MIPAAFVDEYPCTSCEHVKVVYDVPPYTRCRLSNTGSFDCELMQAVARVADRAEQVAALLTREPDRRLRAVEAQNAADSYANTLYELGADLDDVAFLAACGVAGGCVRCEDRKAGDGYTRLCDDDCGVAVAA